jgi:hypothetical protein
MTPKTLKIMGITAALLGMLLTVAILYYNRPQTIEFASLMPAQLEICGKLVNESAPNYVTLANWFVTNKEGWRSSPATYVEGQTFSGEGFSANFHNTGVIVTYESGGSWSQVANQVKPTELVQLCD